MELLSQAEIRKVFERLKKANPNPEPELIYKNAYTLLVSVVLSAQATDKSVNNLYFCSSSELHQTLVSRFYFYNAFDVVFK